MKVKIKCCIAGIHGYVGKELANLILQHPYFSLSGILNTRLMNGVSLNVFPTYSIEALKEEPKQIDWLLLATPAEISIEIVTALQGTSIKILDLSGAFRLSANNLFEWYGLSQQIPELIQGAVYGLSPWGNSLLKNQKILANPGCYATCALMALIPLVQNNIIKDTEIIIDAKSGVSGAGKKAHSELMFCEITDNFFPYKIGTHQHIPEIKKALTQFTNKFCDIVFTTHMLPIQRGIAMSIYLQTQSHFVSKEEITLAIQTAYTQAYAQYPFFKFLKINNADTPKEKLFLSLKTVINTPIVQLGYFVQTKKIILFVCMDNLLKGAASQAVENLNTIYDLPLETGLKIQEAIV